MTKYLLLLLLPACVATANPDTGDDDDDDDKADGVATPIVSDDNLNGLWTTTRNGTKLADDAVIESWPAIGIVVQLSGKTYQLTRTGDHLVGPGVALDVKPNKSGVKDDTFDGTIDGATIHFARDVSVKPPITVAFPGTEPYRSWLVNTILPLAQQDRESYVKMNASAMLSFLTSCELYKHGSWLRTYFKGTTFAEQAASFRKVVYAVDGQTTTPRQINSNYNFSTTLAANLSDPSKIGLAMSTFGMYFSTAAGRWTARKGAPHSMKNGRRTLPAHCVSAANPGPKSQTKMPSGWTRPIAAGNSESGTPKRQISGHCEKRSD